MGKLTKEQLVERATWWDGRSSEYLRNTSYIEALEEVVDYESCAGEGVLQCIARISPVILTAHVENQFSEDRQKFCAQWILDELIESVESDEDIGAGEDGINLSAEQHAACLLKAEGLVAELAKHHKPYWCHEIGSIQLSAQEVEAELREHIPSWFDGFPSDSAQVEASQ